MTPTEAGTDGHRRRLAGGRDGGAELAGGTVRRTAGPWTASVHALLAHLADAGFTAAPRPLGLDERGRELLSYLPGDTVGEALPWPRWVHSDQALTDVAHWLRAYHRAMADFVPGAGARWREGGHWQPGLIIAHNDAAAYNAVWGPEGLRGFVDWDMAGPVSVTADLAWVAFSWVPLHARSVVTAEGFTDFGSRRQRLEAFLAAYGWTGSVAEIFELVAVRVQQQLALMQATAEAGDQTYRRMIELGRDRDLRSALSELEDL